MLKLCSALVTASIACASPASAEVFNVALSKLGNTINGSAQVDVSVESTNGTGAPIGVTVFRADGTREDFELTANANGFATTASVRDLYAAAEGQDSLVRVHSGGD